MSNELEQLRLQEERRRARVKAQNESAKLRWETVSCRLPKGTKEQITAHGETVNGFINRLIKEELARLNNWATAAPLPELEIAESVTAPEPVPSLEELQAQLDVVRAEREQIKPELMTQGKDQEQEEPKIAAPAVTDPEPVSIRELAERTRQAVQEEAEKRAKAAQPTPQEQAVAELLKTRS